MAVDALHDIGGPDVPLNFRRAIDDGESLLDILLEPIRELILLLLTEEGDRHCGSLLGRFSIAGIENSADLSRDETFESLTGNITPRVLLKVKLTALPRHASEGLGDGPADTDVAVTHNKGGPILQNDVSLQNAELVYNTPTE